MLWASIAWKTSLPVAYAQDTPGKVRGCTSNYQVHDHSWQGTSLVFVIGGAPSGPWSAAAPPEAEENPCKIYSTHPLGTPKRSPACRAWFGPHSMLVARDCSPRTSGALRVG